MDVTTIEVLQPADLGLFATWLSRKEINRRLTAEWRNRVSPYFPRYRIAKCQEPILPSSLQWRGMRSGSSGGHRPRRRNRDGMLLSERFAIFATRDRLRSRKATSPEIVPAT
jgi:hypothetical protein